MSSVTATDALDVSVDIISRSDSCACDDEVAAAVAGDEVGRVGTDRTDVVVTGGARLAAATIVDLAIDPNHRGEGVLSELIRRAADDARDRGQVVLTVDSPECGIYERFGFGIATETHRAEIDATRAAPLSGLGEHIRLESLLIEKVPVELPEVLIRCTADQVGAVRRPMAAWHRLTDRLAALDDVRVLVHRDSTSLVNGYVICDLGDDGPEGHGVLIELVAHDAATERGLWQHLMSELPPTRWIAPRRPIDDVARWAFADSRAYRVTGRSDATWLRLVDLDVALGARTYGSTISNVVVQVEDPWYHSNCGTWRIDSYGSFRSQARPDLIAGISEMSSVFLGAVSWVELRDAGRIVERRAGAAYDADVLFAHRPYPFDQGVATG